MRGMVLSMVVMIMGGTALPATAQQDSCLNEIQRLETAFAQDDEGGGRPDGGSGGGGTPNADRAQGPATNLDAISRNLRRSDGVVATAPIGEGVGTTERGVEPVPMNQMPGQQPGGLAGARLSPGQRHDMRAMLREGRAAADRGDDAGCMDKVKQARRLARGATTGAP